MTEQLCNCQDMSRNVEDCPAHGEWLRGERTHIRARDLRVGDVIATGKVTHVVRDRISKRCIVTRQREGRKPFTSTFGPNTTVTARRSS